MAANYAKHVSTRRTPVNKPIPGKKQVANSTGGYAFPVDCWTRLERFLILGNEGGSYYASEQKMTEQNAHAVRECYAQDPKRTIDTITEISRSGRAPKNDPAIFALAMLSTDSYALKALQAVCRIGTHLFQYVDAVQHFRGRGQSLQKALQKWYLDKDYKELSYQLSKYQSRDGWSHRDVLRLCRPTPPDDIYNQILAWSVGKLEEVPESLSEYAPSIYAFEKANQAKSAKEIVKLIEDYRLVRECIPTKFLNDPKVWEALLGEMPLTAMIRNLGKMSSVGLIKPLSKGSQKVVEKLQDVAVLKSARIHPLALLTAQYVYSQGRGMRGSLSWSPDRKIVDALDQAFYHSFKFIEPTEKKHLIALDVSGSMGFRTIAGSPLTPRVAAAAMCMATINSEENTHVVGFSHELVDIPFSKKQRLDDVLRTVDGIRMGATNISLPMRWALENGIETDVFIIYTDNEANRGDKHASQALQEYREKAGIPTKMIVVGMTSNGFTVADPDDAGMMDVVGFDTSAPSVMADFVRD